MFCDPYPTPAQFFKSSISMIDYLAQQVHALQANVTLSCGPRLDQLVIVFFSLKFLVGFLRFVSLRLIIFLITEDTL
eukprot:3228120-Amphidinium_carterae.1